MGGVVYGRLLSTCMISAFDSPIKYFVSSLMVAIRSYCLRFLSNLSSLFQRVSAAYLLTLGHVSGLFCRVVCFRQGLFSSNAYGIMDGHAGSRSPRPGE